jgi:phosphate transport system permease protein
MNPAAPAAAPDRPPLREALSKRSRRRFLGLSADDAIKHFFGGNAALSIVVLFLIMALLLKEGVDFIPLNHFNLSIYREAGLEYVDILRNQVDDHVENGRVLQQIRIHESAALLAQGLPIEEANARLAPFDAFSDRYSSAIDGHRAMLSDLSDIAVAIKQKATDNEDQISEKRKAEQGGDKAAAAAISVQTFDFAQETAPIRASFPAYRQLNAKLAADLNDLLVLTPALVVPADHTLLSDFKKSVVGSIAAHPRIEAEMEVWDPLKPVPWITSLTSFLFGLRWLTASFWQDWYGVVPLFVGSLAVSFVALVLAVPFSIGAAIYVNQIAGRREQRFIKPFIEFIAAVPSVVLGFFGIAVLGATLRHLSEQPFLAWVPFFPMREQLTIVTGGCLLALMAVPTIFTLAEDALNNVPRAFIEASTALGATRLQTIVRIMIPAALSGIISAILLGLGRVIGETMVVLLCVGGRTQIPDFIHKGIGAFFEPAHTMTGIIAQEMGEAVRGTLLHRALFMDGVLLFFISLVINYAAQGIVRRYKLPQI